MNLAVYKGKIYRIGGMAPRNKPGDAVINESVADCARFDPVTMQWEALPPLLKARSSHDVVVVGDELIVVGGWTLKGTADAEWPDTLEILDLSSDTLHWRSVPQPFKRRALIATAHSGKMYVMGGFDENSTVIHEVAIYDPTAGRWAKGSVLPGDELDGFAPAACTHRDRLYVSVGDGTLYRLNESGPTWEKVGNATPRIAHRMVSDGATILILGGATKGKNSDLIEATGSNLPR
jgi:N-acetylneuraminic acid mutarotase